APLRPLSPLPRLSRSSPRRRRPCCDEAPPRPVPLNVGATRGRLASGVSHDGADLNSGPISAEPAARTRNSNRRFGDSADLRTRYQSLDFDHRGGGGAAAYRSSQASSSRQLL